LNFLCEVKLEDQVSVFISPVTGWPNYPRRHQGPLLSPSTARRATVEIF
jgi:hypothetical protein